MISLECDVTHNNVLLTKMRSCCK